MPPRVHLVSISPQLDEDNELALKMTVAGDSRERAIELSKRMEESRRFVQTNILRETKVESQTGDTVAIEMAAIYIPEPSGEAGAASTKPASDAKPKTTSRKPSPKKGVRN